MARLAVIVVLAGLAGCWGADSPYLPSCAIGSESICVFYESDGGTVGTRRMACAAAGGVYSTEGCPFSGRIADCRQANGDPRTATVNTITSYYAPFTRATGQMQCPPAMPTAGWTYVFEAY